MIKKYRSNRSGIYSFAKDILNKYNVPFNQHKSRQINSTDLEYFDYIVAMKKNNINNLNRLLGESKKYSLLLDYTDEKVILMILGILEISKQHIIKLKKDV